MWFLECDSLYGEKRRWLRPGSEHLFGRTTRKPEQTGQNVQMIEHPSVSRQHLLIVVANVKPGDSGHLHSKTTLTITDNSKLGTSVDSQRINKESKVLDKNDHVLKLGNYEHLFRIKWVSVVFSFTSLPRSSKQKDDPLADHRAVLEPLDIKCVTEYVTQYTSHVVAKKRNTSAVLQALVNGRHIITDAYVQALDAVAKKASSMVESLLEVDFDANWPKEIQFLPPSSNEPNPRSANSEDFLPKEGRSEMFTHFTFIFHDLVQYDSLLPVVTGGGGKALLREVTPGQANVQDMIDYVRDVAGKKGEANFKLSQQPLRKGGVVVVRIGDKSSVPGFYEQLDMALGQVSMAQNQFLEAILVLDAAILKMPIEVESIRQGEIVNERTDTRAASGSVSTRLPTTPEASPLHAPLPPKQTDAMDQQSDSAPSQPTTKSAIKRRGIRRPTAQPRFKGFDDFDPDSLPKYRSPSPSQAPDGEQSQAMSVDPIDLEYQSQAVPTQRSQHQTQQSARKRPAPDPIPEENMETAQDVVDGIMKGHAIMKKRRIEEEQRTGKVSSKRPHEEEQEAAATVSIKRPKRRKEKELDVMKAVAERREVEEAALREDEEKLREALQGMDVSEMRDLAQVEEMDILRHDQPHNHDKATGPQSERWDDRWNGRKNFKKFRRRGQSDHEHNVVAQRQRVIVSTEEVKKKAYGLGEDYWLEPIEETRRKEKEKRKQSQQSQQQSLRSGTTASSGRHGSSQKATTAPRHSGLHDEDNDDDDDDEADPTDRFRRRIRNSRLEDAEAERTTDFQPEEIAGTARDADIVAAVKTTKKTAARTQTQTLRETAAAAAAAAPPSSSSSSSSTRKRPAVGGETGRAMTAKRARPSRLAASPEEDEDSDEEDSLRFRRRKR